MNDKFASAMRRALDLTRAGDVVKATSIIQAALAGTAADGSARSGGFRRQPRQGNRRPLIDPGAEILEPEAEWAPEPAHSAISEAVPSRDTLRTFARARKEWAGQSWALKDRGSAQGLTGFLSDMGPNALKESSPPPPGPDGARFLTRSFTGAAGTRSYKLYVPALTADGPRGLVVMLHGCMQTPDDFAVGTNMNAVAGARGLLVAYPAQTVSDNMASCWNWFRPGDQARDGGEPGIIAGITRAIASEFGIERDQTFVAGLSAGGAMAAVMAETYPDLYAAVGIHSGLAHASANDLMSAFAAMRGMNAIQEPFVPRATEVSNGRPRTIVFHGGADQMVHPSNADRIFADARASNVSGGSRSERRTTSDGRRYTRSIVHGADGKPCVEYWLIDQTGHAWSGGHGNGSFTDPNGPDASTEMVRFFLHDS